MDNDMESIYEVVGQNVRRIRKARKLTQVQLAEKSGIENRHISVIERNKTKLSLAAFVSLAKGLDVGVQELLGQEAAPILFDKELQLLLQGATPEQQVLCMDICRAALKSSTYKEKILGRDVD